MSAPVDAAAVISLLGLEPHPEGGWYAQTWRDEAATAIWFLLESGQRSHWHRVHGGVEVWHHYVGDPLELAISHDGTTVRRAVLGPDLTAGERPQLIVPAGAWQAATPVAGAAAGFTLVGCTVAPPFHFESFDLAPPGWEPGKQLMSGSIAGNDERHRRVATNGVELFVREAGPPDGPLVVLVHGFPELSYSWRHQIGALAAAGYHVVAPDMRGYGRSSRPDAIADYDIVHLTDDLLGIVDAVESPGAPAVFVGHDWGALVVWQLSLLHPTRVRGVAALSVPFQRRGHAAPIARMRERFAGAFFYILYFQEPGVADAELDADPAATMRRLFAPTGISGSAAASADDGRGFVERMPEPERLPAWISADEVAVYADEFRRTGFTGGLNWYRNFDRNWELTAHLDGAGVAMPSLFVGGTADPVLTTTPTGVMDGWLADHRGTVLIDGAGHWIQQERPAEVNGALLTFLAGL